jgi:xylan 1,4-beta-xylosidase
VLATNGVNLPVMNVFRMFSKMSGDRLAVTSTREVPLDAILKDGVRGEPDVAALAALDKAAKKLTVMVWHYHDDDIAGPDAVISLALAGLPEEAKEAKVRRHLIDKTHSNAYTLWQQMGSPADPTPEQYGKLESAGRLAEAEAPKLARGPDGKTSVSFALPRQAVTLLTVEW